MYLRSRSSKPRWKALRRSTATRGLMHLMLGPEDWYSAKKALTSWVKTCTLLRRSVLKSTWTSWRVLEAWAPVDSSLIHL